MLILWEKRQQETEFICVAKRTRYVLVWVNRCEYFCHKWPQICFACRNHNPVLHSWFFTGFVTRVPRWVPLVEQELLTTKKHMSSPFVFVRFMLLNLVSCVAFCGSLFVLFLLVIIWSVFRLTASE
jgi:hypothetical protein